jgi:2-polyprenyl-3-methyl-5-hydroxy-6-metoxy-1,4-benzoquinol methylase
VFTNPRPPSPDVDRYYATEYRADYTGAATPRVRKVVRGLLGAKERIRSLQPLLRDGATLLDVGCGAGELVYLLRREGVDAAGLEPGREYAAFAQTLFDIPVQTATVDTATVAAGSQDVITMFHALEHVADPRGVLRVVRGWLKRGGTLVVEVPNVESTVQAPAHRFHYAHLHSFSPATLGAIGEAAGLRLVDIRFSSDGGNVTAAFRRQTDEERLPAGLDVQAAATRSVLRSHTAARHYLSPAPYVRPFRRLAQRWREDRLVRRLKTMEAVLQWVEREFRR